MALGNRVAVKAALRRARDARQPINDDISRAFFRILFELRRQQYWLSRREPILVDDAVPVHITDQTSSHSGGLLKLTMSINRGASWCLAVAAHFVEGRRVWA